jgi:hypothetical protein
MDNEIRNRTAQGVGRTTGRRGLVPEMVQEFLRTNDQLVRRAARAAQAVVWPRSDEEPEWRSGGSYDPADVRSRAARARRFSDNFIKRGYEPDMAAAIAANIDAESGGNYRQQQLPRRRGGPPGPGYGLVQWEPPRQRRFLQSFGYPIQKGSEQDQLDFIDIELAKPEYEYGNARRIAREQGAGNMAAAVMERYERPAEYVRPRGRIDRANLAEALRRLQPDTFRRR